MQLTLSRIKRMISTAFMPNKLSSSRSTLGATGDSWKSPEIPEEQLTIVDRQLIDLRNGEPPSVYTVAAEALNAIPGRNRLTLLDMGCASGYYYEVIDALVGKRFEYTGADYSDAMLTVARSRYPDIEFMSLDIRDIALVDKSFDIVLSGAVLVHVLEWKEALGELTRIARSYLVLHRTPVTAGESYTTQEKAYAGVPIFSSTFNKNELVDLVSECGFRKVAENNVNPQDRKGEGYMTFVFERRE